MKVVEKYIDSEFESIDVNALNKGIYIVEVQDLNSGKHSSKKIIIEGK